MLLLLKVFEAWWLVYKLHADFRQKSLP